MRVSFRLNIAMLKQAEAKVTGQGNDELFVTIIDTFWEHLQKHPATNAGLLIYCTHFG